MSVPIAVCPIGLRCIFMLLENLYKHPEPFRVPTSSRYLTQFLGLVIIKEIHEKYWLPTPPYHRREGFFYLKRVLFRQGSSLFSNALDLYLKRNWSVVKLPRILASHVLSMPYGLYISVCTLDHTGSFC